MRSADCGVYPVGCIVCLRTRDFREVELEEVEQGACELFSTSTVLLVWCRVMIAFDFGFF